MHDYLAQNEIAGDSGNNLMILDYQNPTPVTQDNWAGHFVYGLGSEHVHTVISDGRVIVKDREVLTVDAEAVMVDAREQTERLWRKL